MEIGELRNEVKSQKNQISPAEQVTIDLNNQPASMLNSLFTKKCRLSLVSDMQVRHIEGKVVFTKK
jgi:hypothetical protein